MSISKFVRKVYVSFRRNWVYIPGLFLLFTGLSFGVIWLFSGENDANRVVISPSSSSGFLLSSSEEFTYPTGIRIDDIVSPGKSDSLLLHSYLIRLESLEDKLSEIDKTISTIALDNPYELIMVPAIREDLDNLKEDLKNIKTDFSYEFENIRDANRFIVGLIVTVAIGIFGLLVPMFLKVIQEEDTLEKLSKVKSLDKVESLDKVDSILRSVSIALDELGRSHE